MKRDPVKTVIPQVTTFEVKQKQMMKGIVQRSFRCCINPKYLKINLLFKQFYQKIYLTDAPIKKHK